MMNHHRFFKTKQFRFLMVLMMMNLFAIMCISFYFFHFTQKTLITSQEKSLQNITNAIGSMLENEWVIPREKCLSKLSQSDKLSAFIQQKASFQPLKQEWEIAQSYITDIKYIYASDTRGRFVCNPKANLPASFNPLKRPWFTLAMTQPEMIVWTPIYLDAITGKPILSAAKAIRGHDATTITGVISADFHIDEIQRKLMSYVLPDKAFIYLCDSEFQPIVSTDKTNEFLNVITSFKHKNIRKSLYLNDPVKPLIISYIELPHQHIKLLLIAPKNIVQHKLKEVRFNLLIIIVLLFFVSFLQVLVFLFFNEREKEKLITYILKTSHEDAPLKEVFSAKSDFYPINTEFNNTIRRMNDYRLAISKAEQKLRDLIENAPMGIFRTTMDGCIIDINKKGKEIFGFSDDEIHHKGIILSSYKSMDEKLKINEILARDKILNDFQQEFIRKDGSSVWVSVNARLLNEDNGQPVIDGFIIDITIRKTAEINLSNTQKKLMSAERKNAVLATIVTANHEINQPLMIIKGNLDMLQMKMSEQNCEKYFGRINESILRIEKILSDLTQQEEIIMTSYLDGTDMVQIHTDTDED